MKRVWAILLIVLSFQFPLLAQPTGASAKQLFQKSLTIPTENDTLLAYGIALAGSLDETTVSEEMLYARLLMAQGYLGVRQLQMAEQIYLDCKRLTGHTAPILLGYVHTDRGYTNY